MQLGSDWFACLPAWHAENVDCLVDRHSGPAHHSRGRGHAHPRRNTGRQLGANLTHRL